MALPLREVPPPPDLEIFCRNGTLRRSDLNACLANPRTILCSPPPLGAFDTSLLLGSWAWTISNDPTREPHLLSLGSYSALKTLGERKQTFNEYVQARRNEEKDEERRKQRQAREDFLTMLSSSEELKVRTCRH